MLSITDYINRYFKSHFGEISFQSSVKLDKEAASLGERSNGIPPICGKELIENLLNHTKALLTTAWCQGRYTVPGKYELTSSPQFRFLHLQGTSGR